MASKTQVMPRKEATVEKENLETVSDTPLLDLSDMSVKKLFRSAKKRGYVTHEQINSVLTSAEVNSEQIEDVLAMFSEMGVNVVETEDASDDSEAARAGGRGSRGRGRPVGRGSAKGSGQIRGQGACPAHRRSGRMYLREMGSMELLSRQGEIAMAKRIEAGHEAMIAGCARAR